MGFKQFLKENPDIMTINISGPNEGKKQSLNTGEVITFGWFGEDLLTSKTNGNVMVNGEIVNPQQILKGIDTKLPDGVTVPRQRFTGLDRSPPYHSALLGYYAKLKVLIALNDKVTQLGSNINDTGAFNNLITHIEAQVQRERFGAMDDPNTRSGLRDAGRVFLQIRGVSFYDNAPTTQKVMTLLKSLGEDPDGYVVEDGSKKQYMVGQEGKKTDSIQTKPTEEPSDEEVTRDTLRAKGIKYVDPMARYMGMA